MSTSTPAGADQPSPGSHSPAHDLPTGWTSERHSTLAATIYRNREGRHPQSVWVPDDQRRMIDIIGSQRLTFDEAHSLAWLLIMGTPATE